MTKRISRRDFIKFGWGALQTAALSGVVSQSALSAAHDSSEKPNIVVLVCDAMSAKNLSLYGYPRKTTPNLERLASRAHVYHNHYASGNYTTPGTSSLLTGLLPWTHRAVNHAAVVKKELAYHNIFRFIGDEYHKVAYTQNFWANYLLDQFAADINELLPFSEFGLVDEGITNQVFKKDLVVSHRALEKMLYYGNSLLLAFLTDLYYQPKTNAQLLADYPLGFPTSGIHHNQFTIEGLFDGLKSKIEDLYHSSRPFFAYFHIFPPHYPYNANKDFLGIFDNDGFKPDAKKMHSLADDLSNEREIEERNSYDAFIANLDSEIGRLFEYLEAQGILDNTYFVIVSDHGETFERGMYGHGSPLLYEPLIRIPLLIFAPQNKTRRDFYSQTTNIDLLPTLLSLAGQAIPSTSEGTLLPGFGGTEDSQRGIFAMDALQSSALKPFTKATYTIIKRPYKLIHYQGHLHKYFDYYELYDLDNDPEELRDKYNKPNFAAIAKEMKQELLDAIQLANEKLLAS